ncbi:MAG: Crp/Fnr family transcriptional regulator [Rhizobiaceae bacterium]
MTNPLTRKLSNFVRLSEDERQALDVLISKPKLYADQTDILSEGDPTSGVYFILAGWAFRYKIGEDGRRQIMSYFVPGDICDQRIFVLKLMDHNIGTLTEVSVAKASKEAIIKLTDDFPNIARAFWWSTLIDEAIAREWLMSVGRRNASQRVGHLICEMYVRLRSVGLVDGRSFEFPLTQAQLADTLGLSLVHFNRSLQRLRKLSLISWGRGPLTILDPEKLAKASLFNPSYLHLEGEAAR